jgi:hypothetical protein
MNLGWSPLKIVSVNAALYPRWPPWLKIGISSNGQNCSILSLQRRIFFNFIPLFSNLRNRSK